jgi:uncharacterized heparinase superfamily protein
VNNDPFLVRARRALRRSPRALAARAVGTVQRRARRPWSSIAPRLLTDQRMLRTMQASSIDDLWSRMTARPFFVSFDRRREWIDAFDRVYPHGRAQILEAADAALHHTFDLLGSGPVTFGPHLPWHTDFKTGREWPIEYACDIEYNELDRPTDVKVPWELSRCQHFAALGQAYWLTADERYAREFTSQVDDWIARNRWAYGVNWACAMDVALRAVSWIWALHFFAGAEACASTAFRSRFLRSLFLHGEFIATHLESSDVNGNHYLCDGVGLVFLGVLFAGGRKGDRWLSLGRSIVVDEIARQTSADGVDFEQSTAYQRLVLEAFATAYVLLRAAGERVPDEAWHRLQRMMDYVEAYTKPDGSVPLIGDADDGRIQKLGPQPLNDHRYLLSTGATLFDRPDFKRTASRFWEESFWLLGPAEQRRFDRLPVETASIRSRGFPDGGMFVLRSERAHVIVDCAEVGMRGRGGHGHNDILSFELWLDGVNWITDCGAYLYTASREWRNRFRSTEFHNTIQVDGEELNRFLGPNALWQLHYDAVPTAAAITSTLDEDSFRGGHRGFERLPDPVIVTRQIVLRRDRSSVAITDCLAGRGGHEIVSRFHLDPSVVAESFHGGVRLSSRGRMLACRIDADPSFTMSIEASWVSPRYGVKQPASVIVCRGIAAVPLTLSYTFTPLSS